MAVRPAILSLCSGGGGLDIGVSLAWERITGAQPQVVGYVERESYAASCLVAGMEAQALDHAPIWDDITTFDGRPWRGKVDIVTAGFPCQPHSVAGQRKGLEDERWIWPEIARIIRQVGPQIVFLENVRNILNSGFEHVLGDLAALGFGAEWGVFSAAEVGAPHQRERLFILAYHAGIGRRQEECGKTEECGLEQYRGILAYSQCGERERWRNAGKLASPERDEQGQALQRQRSRPTTGHGGANVGHSQHRGRQEGSATHGRQAGSKADRSNSLANTPECAGKRRQSWTIVRRFPQGHGFGDEDLVHATRQLHNRPRQPGPGWRGEHSDASLLFPPGPASAHWAEVSPALEPAICGMAHGLAWRVDQLRMLGNGVVPLQAAHAFCALWAMAGGEV